MAMRANFPDYFLFESIFVLLIPWLAEKISELWRHGFNLHHWCAQIINSNLSRGNFAMDGAFEMSLSAYMLFLCDRGIAKARRCEGALVESQANQSLRTMG